MRMFSLCLTVLLAANAANAQQRCRDGSKATLSGQIGSIQQMRPIPGENIWVLRAAGKVDGGCAVQEIWGNGNAPKSCSAGKKFSASGEINDADSVWILYANSVTCE